MYFNSKTLPSDCPLPHEQPAAHPSRSRSPTQEVDIRGASEQLERFFRIGKSKKRSQTKFSLRPTFPSHGLPGRHEWPLKCCSCGENNWAEVSCIWRTSFYRGRQKMVSANLGFMARFLRRNIYSFMWIVSCAGCHACKPLCNKATKTAHSPPDSPLQPPPINASAKFK